MPLNNDIKNDKNAVFVEYDPKIAMEKLLTLSSNQNNAEKSLSLKFSPYFVTLLLNY